MAGRPADHVFWQGIYLTDTAADCPEIVVVLCWGGAAKRLQKSDKPFSWDSVNLDSHCLALSLRTSRR